MDDKDDPKEGVSAAFAYCKAFRRMAKRTRALPPVLEEGEEAEQPERTRLLEDVLDFASDLDVWSHGIVRGLTLVLILVYEGKDAEAAEILNHLADEELEALRGKVPEDEEEGGEAPG